MMVRGRNRARILLLLLGAVVVTSAIVALLRYWWIGGWVPSPVGANHVGPLLGTFMIFAVGGVPVALICWSLERPSSGGIALFSRSRIRHVLFPNVLAAFVGIFPIYLFVWDWLQALAIVAGLAAIGSVAFFVALSVGDKVRARAVDTTDVIEQL